MQFYTGALSNKIQDNDAFIKFVKEQNNLLRYACDRYQLMKSTVDQKTAEQKMLEQDETKKLINDFKYMKEHGILDKMKKDMIAHRKKHGLL